MNVFKTLRGLAMAMSVTMAASPFQFVPVAVLAASATGQSSQTVKQRPLPGHLWGLTVDSVANLPALLGSLGGLSQRPTARIIFDERASAVRYKTSIEKITKVAFVMAGLLDSHHMETYSLDQYKARAEEYLDTLGSAVDLWEIGSDVNGEWLGPISSVIPKITAAYELVKSRGGRTALTLTYNEGCRKLPSEEMFSWAEARVPPHLKAGLDYVFVSYNEDECGPAVPAGNGSVSEPDWNAIFNRLATIFPNAKIGFGEVGTVYVDRKAESIARYYNVQVDHPNYVGGSFWLNFHQDMTPSTGRLWNLLNAAIRRGGAGAVERAVARSSRRPSRTS